MHIALTPSSLGQVLVAATEKGIRAILIGNDKATLMSELQKRFPDSVPKPDNRAFKQLVERVLKCVEHPELNHDIPLDIVGTPFQKKVWAQLRKIEPGSTVSYGDIARQIGKPASVRALANACGANHIAVLIPCHRVVRADGNLGGYRWGIQVKKKLLKREQCPAHEPQRVAA